MEIKSYSFGNIVIDGREYGSDILIFPDGRIDDSWWRDQGHVLSMQDITPLLQEKPDIIIAGTGAQGRMKPVSGLESSLKNKGIEFIAKPTEQAVEAFNNNFSESSNTAACLHLTC